MLAISTLALASTVFVPPLLAQGDDPNAPAAEEGAPPEGGQQFAPEGEGAPPPEGAQIAPGAPEGAPPEGVAAPEGGPPPEGGEAPPVEAEAPPAPPPDAALDAAASNPDPNAVQNAVAAIPQPQDDIERAAFAAIDKHCARCHQDGKLVNRVKPSKGFGNVLHLLDLADDPNFIVPGNPEGSKLFTQITSKNMPYDLYNEGDFLQPTPTAEEIDAIRNWILALKESEDAACKGRPFITMDDTVRKISEDLGRTDEHLVKGMRYITLTNLWNACAKDRKKDDEMTVYRQGLIKLLNHLSTNSDLLTLQTVDEEGTIVKFHLQDLNWTEDDWNRIAKVYPYAMKLQEPQYKFVTEQLGTEVPFVRADWLAFTASRPPLYYDLLKMPKTAQELEKGLGVDLKKNIENFIVKRAGNQQSLVSQNNRLIERHPISTGYFWTSYDFAGNSGDKSLFEHPLGPFGDRPFKHDGGESIYSLPNGMQAYYLNVADGKRLDKGPTEIVRDADRKDFAVTNGISCFGCHDQGMRFYKDTVRPHIEGNRGTFSREVRDTVAALYPTHDEMDAILKADAERFKNAMLRAGLDPTLKLGGAEMINALSNKYEKEVNLRLAAAEFGLTPEQFEDAALQEGGDVGGLLRRLKVSAIVPRDNFEHVFPTFVDDVTDNESIFKPEVAVAAVPELARVNEGDQKVEGKVGLTLVPNKAEYGIGEQPFFVVQSDKDCFLTLINIDGKGTGTVLVPNKFAQDNTLKAGEAFQFPPEGAPYKYRMKDPGDENVIAICSTKGKTVDLIKHNFNTDAFTNLGDYGESTTRAIEIIANDVKEKAKSGEFEKPVDKIAVDSGESRVAIKVTVK